MTYGDIYRETRGKGQTTCILGRQLTYGGWPGKLWVTSMSIVENQCQIAAGQTRANPLAPLIRIPATNLGRVPLPIPLIPFPPMQPYRQCWLIPSSSYASFDTSTRSIPGNTARLRVLYIVCTIVHASISLRSLNNEAYAPEKRQREMKHRIDATFRWAAWIIKRFLVCRTDVHHVLAIYEFNLIEVTRIGVFLSS